MSPSPTLDHPLSGADQAPTPVQLRHTFRHAAASTWVVTGTGPRGPVGFTCISVASVSLDPPLVSFNISRASSSLATIVRSGEVALHLLAVGQAELADRFAGDRTRRFVRDGAWTVGTDGLPELLGVAARLVARLEDLVDAGDSFLALGLVRSTTAHPHEPLLHYAGQYTALPTIGVRA